jgi:hypothetical protein
MTNKNSISDSLNRLNLVTTDYNRGFTMTFANRITVSIRWGNHNYSDGKTTAEVAAWDADTHEWVHVTGFDYNSDNVLGHLTTNEVAKFIHAASTMPSAIRSNA